MKEKTKKRMIKKAKSRNNKKIKEKLWVLRQEGYSLRNPPPPTSYLFAYFQSARQLIKNENLGMDYMPSSKPVSADFYSTQEWRAARYDALRKNNGKCELCGSGKHNGSLLHVDHIKPRSRYPELELDLNNLQVLCDECNLGKGNRDTTDWREK